MSDLRDEFEKAHPMPEGVIRYGDGYIMHTIGPLGLAFSFIKAEEFIARFMGYKEGIAAAAKKSGTVPVPIELAERLARPNPDLHGWVTFNTADMVLAAKELRDLMNKEGV